MRKLRHHEQKLLKKVDFLQYRKEKKAREGGVLRRYHIQNAEDYNKYNSMCGLIQKIANQLSALDPRDEFRISVTDELIEKLTEMGILTQKKSLSQCQRVTVSQFCRRRLPVIMMRLKMAESVKIAAQYVEQGHVRVGPHTVTDPAFFVIRDMEDYVTWVDTSKIKRTIMKYNDRLDDFDLL